MARPTGNNLLGALRADDLALLSPHFEEWRPRSGQAIYNAGDRVTHVYFPCERSVASLLVMIEEGQVVEIALIGREGAIGGVVSDGGLPAYAHARVQSAGLFLRMAIADLDAARGVSPAIRRLFLRYADCLLAQLFQSVACNAVHTIEQRAAKWLLATMDRTGEETLSLTQDQLAGMLGVSRSYFTRMLKSLRAQGLIETGRGTIRVPDRSRLEHVACRCNNALRCHFQLALEGVYPNPIDPKECDPRPAWFS